MPTFYRRSCNSSGACTARVPSRSSRQFRKIDRNEAPFDEYGGDPECLDPFLDEWFDAYYSVETLGSCCLCLVHDTLKQFLEEFITSTGRTVPVGQGSWAVRYKAFFFSEYKIDWDAVPLDMSIMEQIVLARNQLQHSGDLMAAHIWQSADHQRKAPSSMFVEDIGRPVKKLSIRKESLFRAIDFVNNFGRFLLSATTETVKIRYVSPFDAFERVDNATALELLKQEIGEDD